MKRSLRWQFFFPLFFVFILIFAGLFVYLSRSNRAIHESQLKDTLVSEAYLLANELRSETAFTGSTLKLQQVVSVYGEYLEERVTIIQPDGVVLADSESNAALMENHLSRPEVLQAVSGNTGYQIRFSTTMQTSMLYVAVPVYEDGEIIAVVRLARSTETIENDLRGMNLTILISGLCAFLLLLLISYLIFQKATSPLTQLIEVARLFPNGKTAYVQVRKNGNEIDELAKAFNQMADQINQQIYVLEEQKTKLSNILNQMQDGVVIVDEHSVVSSINPSAEEMFDVNAKDVVGKPLMQSLHYYQIAELVEKTNAARQQSSALIELQSSHKHLNILSSPLEEPANRSVLLLFQDLTKQRQLELMRKEFVGNVSHELRTPLASLRALTETLQSGALEEPQTALHFLELIETEVDKLTQMVDELLALSKIESGHVPLSLTSCKPDSIIQQAISRMSMQAKRARISLGNECDKDLPEISADTEQLERVLINLIHNAIKFTLPGGQITIRATRDKKAIVFSVNDTGSGIAAEDLPRIFERFYKTDRSRASRGTGLGLSIVKHIVELHKGRVWVESQVDHGSTFYFSIPMSLDRVN